MKNIFKIIGIFAIFGVVGIGIYAGKVYKDIKNLCFELVKYEFKGFNGANVLINFVLKIKNISIVKIKIVGYEFDIFINNIKIGSIKDTQEQIIKSEQYSMLNIPIEIDVIKSFGLVKSSEILNALKSDPSKIVVSLKGLLAAEVFKLKVKNIPIDYSITLKEILEIMKTPSTKC